MMFSLEKYHHRSSLITPSAFRYDRLFMRVQILTEGMADAGNFYQPAGRKTRCNSSAVKLLKCKNDGIIIRAEDKMCRNTRIVRPTSSLFFALPLFLSLSLSFSLSVPTRVIHPNFFPPSIYTGHRCTQCAPCHHQQENRSRGRLPTTSALAQFSSSTTSFLPNGRCLSLALSLSLSLSLLLFLFPFLSLFPTPIPCFHPR